MVQCINFIMSNYFIVLLILILIGIEMSVGWFLGIPFFFFQDFTRFPYLFSTSLLFRIKLFFFRYNKQMLKASIRHGSLLLNFRIIFQWFYTGSILCYIYNLSYCNPKCRSRKHNTEQFGIPIEEAGEKAADLLCLQNQLKYPQVEWDSSPLSLQVAVAQVH